jgi:hypothetical protein
MRLDDGNFNTPVCEPVNFSTRRVGRAGQYAIVSIPVMDGAPAQWGPLHHRREPGSLRSRPDSAAHRPRLPQKARRCSDSSDRARLLYAEHAHIPWSLLNDFITIALSTQIWREISHALCHCSAYSRRSGYFFANGRLGKRWSAFPLRPVRPAAQSSACARRDSDAINFAQPVSRWLREGTLSRSGDAPLPRPSGPRKLRPTVRRSSNVVGKQ